MAYPENYNLFAMQKQQNYPNAANKNLQGTPVLPGNVVGETPEQFAQGKAAANSMYGTPQQAQTVQSNQTTGTSQARQFVPAQTVNNNINPKSETAGMDLLSSMYTSPEQEEKYRKASVANQRILAVADALRHIGNIYNTVNYAPAQKLNNPVQEEADRYLKGKALRDAANMRYLSYQQQKANQEARIRQAEAQLRYNMEKDARDYELKKKESDAKSNLNEAKIHRYETMMALDEARRQGVISDNEYKKRRAELYPDIVQSQIAKNNRTGGRSGGSGGSPAKYWVYDEDGNKHYYHNKTMYEQGVEQYGNNLPQTETYKTTDQYGDTRTVERRTPSTKKGGTLARNAERKKTTQKKKTGGINWVGGSTQPQKKEKKSVGGIKWQ